MNLGRIWDVVHTVLRKESSGNTITPERFSSLLQQCHLEYYNQQYEKWAGSQTITDSLMPFASIDEVVYLVAGSETVSSLTYTYKHAISARVMIDPTNLTTEETKINIVTPSEWNEWMYDPIMKPTADYPIMTIAQIGGLSSLYLRMQPQTFFDGYGTVPIYFSYFIELVMDTDKDRGNGFYLPFFDYYRDSSYNVHYLKNGETFDLDTDVGSVARDGSTTGVFTSHSHDLLWDTNDRINIVSMLLEKLGVSLQSPEITQYAMGVEQKQNVT